MFNIILLTICVPKSGETNLRVRHGGMIRMGKMTTKLSRACKTHIPRENGGFLLFEVDDNLSVF